MNGMWGPITLVLVIGVVGLLRGPIGRAIADAIRNNNAPPSSRGDAVPSSEVLTELEQLRTRLAEVEERLDFAERMLARQRDAAGLREGSA
jgi:hypothetical protein